MQGLGIAERREMEDRLEELALVEGNGTSLISLFVPMSQPQQARARAHIREEKGLCVNIKDSQVRQAVQVRLLSDLSFSRIFPVNFL